MLSNNEFKKSAPSLRLLTTECERKGVAWKLLLKQVTAMWVKNENVLLVRGPWNLQFDSLPDQSHITHCTSALISLNWPCVVDPRASRILPRSHEPLRDTNFSKHLNFGSIELFLANSSEFDLLSLTVSLASLTILKLCNSPFRLLFLFT